VKPIQSWRFCHDHGKFVIIENLAKEVYLMLFLSWEDDKMTSESAQEIIEMTQTFLKRGNFSKKTAVAAIARYKVGFDEAALDHYVRAERYAGHYPADEVLAMVRVFSEIGSETKRCKAEEALRFFQLTKVESKHYSSLQNYFPRAEYDTARKGFLTGVWSPKEDTADSFWLPVKAMQQASASVDDLFKLRRDRQQIPALLNEAKYMQVMGISLDVFFLEHFVALTRAARRGVRLEFMLVDPNAAFLDEVDVNAEIQIRGDDFRNSIWRSIERIEDLAEPVRENITLRFTGSIVYSSIILVGRIIPAGAPEYMAIEPYAFGAEGGKILSIEIERAASPKTFSYFEEAIQYRWDNARTLEQLQAP
jgi:hypothetical protein